MPFDIYILSFKDILDILLVAFLLYKSYKLMKSSGSINIFIGILVFIIIWVIVSQVLQMRLLGSIFDKLVSVGVIALIVLFQDEIRHFIRFQTPQQQPVPFPERQQKDGHRKRRHHAYRDGLPEYE